MEVAIAVTVAMAVIIISCIIAVTTYKCDLITKDQSLAKLEERVDGYRDQLRQLVEYNSQMKAITQKAIESDKTLDLKIPEIKIPGLEIGNTK